MPVPWVNVINAKALGDAGLAHLVYQEFFHDDGSEGSPLDSASDGSPFVDSGRSDTDGSTSDGESIDGNGDVDSASGNEHSMEVDTVAVDSDKDNTQLLIGAHKHGAAHKRGKARGEVLGQGRAQGRVRVCGGADRARAGWDWCYNCQSLVPRRLQPCNRLWHSSRH